MNSQGTWVAGTMLALYLVASPVWAQSAANEDQGAVAAVVPATKTVADAPAKEVADATAGARQDLFTDDGNTGLDALETAPVGDAKADAGSDSALADFLKQCAAKQVALKACTRMGGLKGLACRKTAEFKYRELKACPEL